MRRAVAAAELRRLESAQPRQASIASGNRRGAATIERVCCTSCHTIKGIAWPQGKTAAVVTHIMAGRAIIADQIEDRADGLAAFVGNGPELVPDTAIPTMPLSGREALDTAPSLYKRGR